MQESLEFSVYYGVLLDYGLRLSGGHAEERWYGGIREEFREGPGGVDWCHWSIICGCQVGHLGGAESPLYCRFSDGTDLVVRMDGEGRNDGMRERGLGVMGEGEDIGVIVAEFGVGVCFVENVVRRSVELLVQDVCRRVLDASCRRLAEVRVGPGWWDGRGEWVWVLVGVEEERLGKRTQRS